MAVACTTESHDINVSEDNLTAENKQFIAGTANVLFSEEIAEMLESSLEGGSLVTKSTEINSIFEGLGVVSCQRLFPYAGEFEPRTRKAGLHRWYKVKYDENIALTRAEDSFAGLPGVEEFEAERRIELNSLFNDPKFGQQWHYYNDGSLSSDFTESADINVVPVWDNFTTGSRSVVVAVVDAGVDYEHEDIAANYVGGMNFGTGGKITPDDHGTHVAGTIAAVNNNGVGVCGIAGGNAEAGVQGVGILGCQIFSGNNPVGGAEAIKWAADNGAHIANNSWGFVYEKEEAAKNAQIPSSLAAAIDYFIQFAGCDNEGNQLPDSPMKGGVILFSAGNDAWRYNPICEYEPVVAVGSIGPDFTRAYYSCYGEWVDIAAPGGSAKVSKGMVYSTIVGNKYDHMQGTSMACPHASGVAALIASYFGGPGFTNEMLLERLIGGARHDVIPTSAKVGPLLDALGSFTLGGTVAPEKVEDFELDAIGNKITLSINVTADEDDVKAYEYIVLMSEDQSLLEGVSLDAKPDGVRELRIKTGTAKVGEAISLNIPDMDFEKEYFFSVIAADYVKNYSEQSPVKSVRTLKNNAPIITPAQEMSRFKVRPFETLTLGFDVKDPEGDDIKVSLDASRAGLTLQKTSNGLWTITVSGSVSKAGQYKTVLMASDKHGLTSEYSVEYEVLENSVPGVKKEFEDLFIEGNSGTFTFDLNEYFADQDGEVLTYSSSGSNKTVCEATINGNILTITVKGYGLNVIKITASDAKKANCSQEIHVMAKDPQNLIEMYPVPVVDVLNVRTGQERDTHIVIKSASGHTVYENTGKVSAFEPAAIDMTHCAPGKYVIYVTLDGKVTDKVITKI